MDSNEAANSPADQQLSNSDLDLPKFYSLPAAAGLTNTEAFQLSVRHALAMLPALAAQGLNTRATDNPERFRLP